VRQGLFDAAEQKAQDQLIEVEERQQSDVASLGVEAELVRLVDRLPRQDAGVVALAEQVQRGLIVQVVRLLRQVLPQAPDRAAVIGRAPRDRG
jgi:hypothetical protein